jgi:hypothetical protein
MTNDELLKVKRLMQDRDHSDLLSEDRRRTVLLDLADAVPRLVAEVERLQNKYENMPWVIVDQAFLDRNCKDQKP